MSLSPFLFSVSICISHSFYFAISAVSIIACVLVYPLNLLSFYLSRPLLHLRFSLYLAFPFSSISLSSPSLLSSPPPPNSYLSLLWLYNLDESLVASYRPEGPPDHHLFSQQKSHLKAYNSWFCKFLVGAAT
jgi:hypothetical protein